MRTAHRQRPSPGELRVLRALAEHGTIHAAARALHLSPHTVDWHLASLRKKTGLRYVNQLIAAGAEKGWLEETIETA